MKNTFAIAALISAAAVLTPANATTILTTTLSTTTPGTLSLGTGNGYLTAVGYDNQLPALPSSGIPVTTVNPPYTSPLGVSVAKDSSNVSGLGIASGSEIGPSDFVVLDFANKIIPAGNQITSIAFTLNIDVAEPAGATSDWVIYGENANGSATLLDWGQMTSTGIIPIAKTTTSAVYTNYLIGIEGDCEIDIEQVSITYSKTPEPGTFVMAGMALIGLGVTMKKRQQKS